MKTYYVVGAVPQHADDVAILLDADITKSRFRRSNTDLWHDAIKTRALTRVPTFQRSYKAYIDSNYAKDNEAVLSARLISRASDIATKISWMTGGKLGKPQLSHAIDGATFMTFEKSVVCILALNALIVEDIGKYQKDLTPLLAKLDATAPKADSASQSEVAGDGAEQNREAKEITEKVEAVNKMIESLTSGLIGEHSIIVSCFYFYNIRPVVDAALASGGFISLQNLANFIASKTKQTPNLIKNLLGPVDQAIPTGGGIDRAVKHVASYPTMRAIFKTLLEIPACRAVVGTTNREDYIQRLHVGVGNKTAVLDEKMIAPQKITRPPYNWGSPDPGAEHYPPGYEDDEPQSD